MNHVLDGRVLRTDLARADRTIPVTDLAGSRDPGATSSTECPTAEITQAHDLQQRRSARICETVWLGAERPERLGNR